MKKLNIFKKTSIYNKQIIIILLFFLFLFLIITLDEVLDLPYHIFGAPRTPVNTFEILIEIVITLIILLILLLIIKKLHDTQKRTEKELMIGKERLKILNKILRHDLSNDFIVIRSAINLFKKSSDPNMLLEIEKRVKKSLETIAEYRKYEAFIDINANLDEIEVYELINDIIAEFPIIKFNFEGKCKVFADDSLYSVFRNLITNSINHGDSSKIDIRITNNAKFCKIEFCDNGKGIPDKIKDKIFDEGFIYGNNGRTGIGLYIVKQIIESFDGSISVMDNQPNGAIFIINLRKVLKT